MPQVYIDATHEAAATLFSRDIKGEVMMLNLLRLKAVADYSASPELTPATPVSGREALQKYIDHTLPYLRQSGGELSLLGEGGRFFIGPPDECWDVVMLVKQASLKSFLAFATNTDYLAGMGHRTAAVMDSRLLPIVPSQGVELATLQP